MNLNLHLILLVLLLVAFVFWVAEFLDVVRRQFAHWTIKLIWLLVVLLGNFIGGLVYYFVGRRQGTLPGKGGPT